MPLLLVACPLVFGTCVYFAKTATVRNALVACAAVATMAAGVIVAISGPLVVPGNGALALAALAAEAAAIITVIVVAIRIRSWSIGALGALQLALSGIGCMIERGQGFHAEAPAFVLDSLSTILVLVVSLVGPVIVLYAIGYMKKHHEHAHPGEGSDRRFFLLMVGFLGVMNGLVLANSLRWLGAFWEATTLCSFFLIGHTGTAEAKANAKRALLLNSVGGVALAGAAVGAARAGADSLSGIMAVKALAPMALLCVAAFTKSAQMPFQSWLLGAMVAPTPVSALLHSATMVKAGSYLVLRLAPAFSGQKLMFLVAIAGAFTFAVASTLAVGQSNAKKVLAYSTISNLGLIVACAGINTPLAYAAALMILSFHAVSKGLLFICIGTIEQFIRSRDIEDMGSIMFQLPVTTVIALTGMLSMLLPPFGMLLSKWMAIEAAIASPLILVLVIAGSALTVLFWAKWIGRIQTVSYHPAYRREQLPPTMLVTEIVLAAAVVILGVAAIPLYHRFIEPLALSAYAGVEVPEASLALLRAVKSSMVWPVFLFIGLAAAAIVIALMRFNEKHVRLPFLCGENCGELREGGTLSYSFRGMKDARDTAWSATLYFRSIIHEGAITRWCSLLALLILIAMFGEIGVI